MVHKDWKKDRSVEVGCEYVRWENLLILIIFYNDDTKKSCRNEEGNFFLEVEVGGEEGVWLGVVVSLFKL